MIKSYEEIGNIDIRPNARSKTIVVRYRDGMFLLSHPISIKQRDIEKAIFKLKERLLAMKHNAPKGYIFTPDTNFETYSFSVKIVEKDKSEFTLVFRDSILYIICPQNTDYTDKDIQDRIRKAIIQVMRNEAKRIFPPWLKRLAEEHNFEVASVKINNSQSRWGSCSSKKNINLSLFCMLLPQHLIELIILHELCHTVEMNHSARFWSLLDKVTNGRSTELTAELKKFRTNF